ncbi:AIPR protein [Spirosoma oryzae]|uniref:AIPR protein n=1 Tax=Spirosoma oryzae TaxID=1469603 RepID=A0A2T0RNG4_9BACT|nr:AIPR family protein [Spirosoma oryzae]PRY22734.1 AIPR protein [Spirosoma oryzae]
MDIKEFATEFLEQALITAESEVLSQEAAITRDIFDYVTDSSEAVDPVLCYYRSKGIKINAYDYDDDDDALSLFSTIPKLEANRLTVADSEVSDLFGKMLRFHKDVVAGKLQERIDESNEELFELMQIISEAANEIKTVRLFVLTNGRAGTDVLPQSFEIDGVFYEHQLWDIERLYQHDRMRAGKQKIEIDFLNTHNVRLKCLSIESISDTIDVYLTIIPGALLAKIYGQYRQTLLEKNVRTFLQFKAKVNKEIRTTIKDKPDLFLAYNNGISTTAEDVGIFTENGMTYINYIENLQIVNGGQTTASIFATSQEKDIDLSRVFVQMKVSVIRATDRMDDIVADISRYANSQTSIKDSDFSSNNPYHIAIENFSRSEWIPSRTGGRATSKWFYERTRGQYLDEQSRRQQGVEQKKFLIEYPKLNRFNKGELAKYEMSWLQHPYLVSRGAENNFKEFTKEIVKASKVDVSKKYYHQLIGKAILFKVIDKLVQKKSLGGYKANMVSYLIAFISSRTNKKLNLEQIWVDQDISENLRQVVDRLIPIVWRHITAPDKPGMNIGEWCKKQECWIKLKDKLVDIDPLLEDEIADNNLSDSNELISSSLTPQESAVIDEVMAIAPSTWFGLAKWAKDEEKLTPFDRKLSFNLGILVKKDKGLTIKQAKNGLRIMKSAKEQGFQIVE